MRMWDESMFAVNTYEMMQNGNYFTLYYNGVPDLYNTKPPLTVWLQLISVKLFGYNELAIRLPSATAAFFTISFLFRFVARYFDYIKAWIVALILISSAGFVGYHTSRTGESDAILTFFLFLLNLKFIQFLIEGKKQTIFLCFVFLTLAFATKLYAGFLFIPAYLFLLLYYEKFKAFVLTKEFLAGFILFIVVSLGLLYLRELESPGYLKVIWMNDAGRLLTVSKEFEKTGLFYLENLYEKQFSLYFLPLIIGCVLIFIRKREQNQQQILVASFALVMVYLLIISFSQTKLSWYDMPLYPFLALITAGVFQLLTDYFSELRKGSGRLVSYLTIILIFSYPYHYRFCKSQGNRIDDGDIVKEANERYLFQAIRNGTDLDGLQVLYRSYNGPLLFYKYKLHDAGQEINLHTNTDNFKAGDRVLICKEEHRQELEESFDLLWVDGYQYADVYLLK